MFCLVVFLDIPIARQVIGFVYLTFVPGFIFLRLLKMENLDAIETILFSVGFSLGFIMAVGLLVNEMGLIMGLSNPLTLMPSMIALNSVVIIVSILGHIRDGKPRHVCVNVQSRNKLAFLLFLVGVPILSVVGAIWVKAFENNIFLIFLIVIISLVFAVGVIFKKLLPPKFYSLAVFVIAISLLYHSTLISNYIISFGSDVTTEYAIFKSTQNNARWGPTEFNPRLSSMLDITILPTLYSNFLKIDSTWTFKILFPLFFSFVPLGLYHVWKKYLGEKYAFVSAFLFMAQQTFYNEMVSLNRQMVAELFFVLLLIIILDNKMKKPTNTVLFIIFSFGLVTSHYGLSLIFLFFISLTFILLSIVKKSSRTITASMIMLFFVIMFTWYIYTSRSAVFDSILNYSNYVYNQLGEFFDPASRGQDVLRGIGLESPPTIWNAVSRAFAYFIQFLIAVGFVALVTKRIKVNVDRNYFILISIAITFLSALILVPGLAKTLNMTRFYHILLFFLAPLSIIGAMVLINLLSKRKREFLVSILLLIVLTPYFLFQTSFVYELTESESWSVPLSKYKMDSLRLYCSFGYIDGYSVFGAQWLSKKIDIPHTQIYADVTSARNVLIAYGMITLKNVKILSNVTKISANDTVYLSSLNIVGGIIIGDLHLFNSSELSFINDTNKIYANGECEIYKGT